MYFVTSFPSNFLKNLSARCGNKVEYGMHREKVRPQSVREIQGPFC